MPQKYFQKNTSGNAGKDLILYLLFIGTVESLFSQPDVSSWFILTFIITDLQQSGFVYILIL